MNRNQVRKGFKPPRRSTGAEGSAIAVAVENVPKGPSSSRRVVSNKSPANLGVGKKEELASLKSKELELDGEIKILEEARVKTEELQKYIEVLHEYNEVKDVAQMFMGRLAIYECVTNREISRRYNAPESD